MARPGSERGAGSGVGLLSGRHPVLEALRARRRSLHELMVREGSQGQDLAEILALAGEAGVPVEQLAAKDFDRRAPSASNPQGVILRTGELPDPFLEELVPDSGPCTLVALDGVEDPQNLGAIARVADAAGAAGMILTRRHSPPLSTAASRASSGGLEWLPVARVANLAQALNSLKQQDFWIYGADGGAAEEVYSLADRVLSARRVLVLGAEGRGLRDGVLNVIDHRVRIPMHGHVESLNVATAAAVLLYELARRAPEREKG